jgi:hypothetical protein
MESIVHFNLEKDTSLTAIHDKDEHDSTCKKSEKERVEWLEAFCTSNVALPAS